jgi:tight adherence protein B
MIPAELTRLVEKGAAETRLGSSLEGMLARAGWSVRVGDLMVGSVLLMGAAAFVGAVTLGPIAAAIAAPVAGAIPSLVVSSAGSRRVGKLQGQLADVCMILASSLRAGHSFLQSLDTVSKEIGEPAATEFNRALAEIRLGRPVEEALTALADRIASVDLEWAVTAINIQRKVGGNLAEVLETVAGTIRERETLRRQVRALTSEGRLSATILTVLPFLIAGYLMMVNPKYLANLTETSIGVMAIGVAGILMIVGYVWMRRIVKIDV